MRFHRAEIYFFVMLVMLGLGGASAWAAWSALGGTLEGGAPTAEKFAFMGMVLTGLSGALGLLLIFPLLSSGVRERGKLQKITESLSVRSQNLEQAAVTDGLTGMHNRRYFDDAMTEYLTAFRRIDKPIGMAILDLDHFKKVNDTWGHDAGDEVLRQVALCLQEFTRYHDVVARLGGEEFAILSPNITERQLYNLADRIRQAVASLNIDVGSTTLKVTMSAGLAIWNGLESGEDLYRRADKQLYEAKRQGRNRVCAA